MSYHSSFPVDLTQDPPPELYDELEFDPRIVKMAGEGEPPED